ncbi:unnamed protein product [Brachionus calyciflorus]|uniref:Uncharacterized protein n=1 Tax=Brachionus calyciflorus TaxID=104777 RepID=A0A813M8K3_9BILA|nr:unnamed protein product [Brachionus calyciflorus]
MKQVILVFISIVLIGHLKCFQAAPTGELTAGGTDPEIIRNALKLEKKLDTIKNERLQRLNNKINEIKSRKDFEQNQKIKNAVSYIEMFVDVIKEDAQIRPKYVHYAHKLENTTVLPDIAQTQPVKIEEISNTNEIISNEESNNPEIIAVNDSNEILEQNILENSLNQEDVNEQRLNYDNQIPLIESQNVNDDTKNSEPILTESPILNIQTDNFQI